MDIMPHFIPFRVGSPIQDPVDFIGRREALQAISNAMLSLQNVFVYGERRTGKTSLLLYLAHPASSSVIGLPETHIPVYFNFQAVATTSTTNVWQAVAHAIAEQIEQRHPGERAESEHFLSILTEFLASSETSELLGTGFGRALSYLDNLGFKIHLLFDEFEQTVRNPNLGDPFYDTLRSLPTRAENISYVIAMRTGLTALQPAYSKISSPLFNMFTRITLCPFQENEVYQLISVYFARAELDTSLAEKLCAEFGFLYRVTGYHPFFLQTLCYHLLLKLDKPDWPRGQARREALQAFEKDAEPNFEYYWRVSSVREQGLIRKLAAGHSIDWDKPEIITLIENLKDRCLVVPATELERGWRLFSSAFGNWVQRVVYGSIQGLYDEACKHLAERNWKEAAQRFQDVLLLQPDFPKAVEKLDYARQGQNAELAYQLGLFFTEHRWWKEGIAKLEEVKASGIEFPDLSERLEEAHQQLKKENFHQQAETPVSTTSGRQTQQGSETRERGQGSKADRKLDPTWLTILSVILEFIVLGLIINILPNAWLAGDIDQLILLGGLLLISLSLLLLVIFLRDRISVTPDARLFIYCLFGIGILLLTVRMAIKTRAEPSSSVVMETPSPVTMEALPPVLAFTILEPRELDAQDEFKAISGILQLKSNIPTSSLDIKIYIKLDTETRWQLSDLNCFATIRNQAWRIEPDCVRFDLAHDSFTVVAVLVDANHIYELPGSVAPHHVEAAEFADLKNKVLHAVYGEDESSISQPIDISRIVVGTVPPPTSSPTSTPMSADIPILTPTREQTATPTFESTAEPTTKATTEFTPTSIPTPISLLPAVIIDDQETQQERRADGKDHYRLLRWKPWSGEAPDGWYYVIRFLPANDPNSVFTATIVSTDAAIQGHGENAGWLTYSFDILSLPNNEMSCYPYWDVIVGIDASRVNCSPLERNWKGICRLTHFSEKQQALATARPGTCSASSRESTGDRRGSTHDPGHLPIDQ
jgi:hypothetical protein